MAKTTSVVVHHPYPSFFWEYKRNTEQDYGSIDGYPFLGGQGDATLIIYEGNDANAIQNEDAGHARCTITAAGHVIVTRDVAVTVSELGWLEDITGDVLTLAAPNL